METPTVVKTPADVLRLKQDWLEDPCYDLTGIEGFEMYADELAIFQQAQEARWEVLRQQRTEHDHAKVLAKAESLGTPGNVALTSYIIALEKRISMIESERK